MRNHKKFPNASLPLRRYQDDKGIMLDDVSVKFLGCRISGRTRSILLVGAALSAGGLLVYKGYRTIKRQEDNKDKYEGIIPSCPEANYLGTESSENNSEIQIDNETEVRNWIEYFYTEFPLRLFDLPPVIDAYFVECPIGFEVPVITALTAELALCFSKVEAKYLDGRYHRPNIQTLIEGTFGSGKGAIKQIHDTLFSRRIKKDNEKLSNPDGKRKIIQTIAPNITAPALADILANNQGVHAIMVDPEARTIVNALKKNNGISYEILRKAYDNDEHYRMNRDKNAPQGSFPIAINIVVTGTPRDTEAFIGKEHEGGTSSRMALSVLPVRGKDLTEFVMPKEAELLTLQNRIDSWTEKYSYFTDEDGNDVPAQTYPIDLSYVSSSLKDWLEDQYELGDNENNQARKDLRARIASTVFNCAIVWHMLYGEPTAKERGKRAAITSLSIYMANYLIERWLHKYGKQHNVERAKLTAEEMVSVRRAEAHAQNDNKSSLPEDGMERGRILSDLNEKEGLSYNKLGEQFGLTKDQVAGYIRRYRERILKESEDNTMNK